jgi:hypothetical protein
MQESHASDYLVQLGIEANRVVGEPLTALGNGLSTAVSALGNLLPILVLGALIVVALPYINKARAPAAL